MEKRTHPKRSNHRYLVDGMTQTIKSVDQKVESVLENTDKYIDPVRKSAIRRFPTLFIILTTFGVSATFFGFELMVTNISFLHERPLLILIVGVGILLGTGTLYKKLG